MRSRLTRETRSRLTRGASTLFMGVSTLFMDASTHLNLCRPQADSVSTLSATPNRSTFESSGSTL
ncbi:hypothetical protein Taro_033677 [Colocasia esculenta]|uniref:Uncharacterized protein n=1 Tax=Colocasia esculenta TaxID=4460 RepID=A0A843W248_COLES|nr:hypothetical protein [Colocasia esculenta]